MPVERPESLDQDVVVEVLVVLVLVAGEAQEREGGAVGHGEVAEQVVAAGEQALEDVERRGDLGAELLDACRIGLAFPRSSSSSFGGRFQTRLNQSRKSSVSARRAGSLG